MPTDRGLAVAFAGTPDFAVPSLDAIAASRHRIVAAFTQPDRPSGRGRHLAASPVKERALALGIPVLQPASLKGAEAARAIAAFAPDVMVVVAYGLLLPPEVLAVPRLGCLNVHASLLPRWRGAAPVARAILAGDARTGVCIMRMEAGLDTGPGDARARGRDRRARDPRASSRRGSRRWAAPPSPRRSMRSPPGAPSSSAQDPARATYAAKLTKAEARLDWREDAAALERRVRALNPRPVAETTLDGAQLRIHEAEAVSVAPGPVPGTIVSAGADGIVVMAGEGALALRRVQLPGRRAVGARELANARSLVGRVLA